MLTQLKLARYLTEEEKQAFLDGFYREWKVNFDFSPDLNSPNPWGCIWSHGAYGGETIVDCSSLTAVELQGAKYFYLCKAEILDTQDQPE
jgi:hypothetical protein